MYRATKVSLREKFEIQNRDQASRYPPQDKTDFENSYSPIQCTCKNREIAPRPASKLVLALHLRVNNTRGLFGSLASKFEGPPRPLPLPQFTQCAIERFRISLLPARVYTYVCVCVCMTVFVHINTGYPTKFARESADQKTDIYRIFLAFRMWGR